MEFKHILVSLIAVLSLLVFVTGSVSAFVAQPFTVEVNGVDVLSGSSVSVAAFAGQTIPVRVTFTAIENAADVRVKAEISGGKDYDAVSERFDVIVGQTYSRVINVQIPFNIEQNEPMQLDVTIENRARGEVASRKVAIGAQRESYVVQVLNVAMDSSVQAGETLAMDIVLKNRGRHFSEDTFVKVSVPALGLERQAYFGDLAPVDQSNPDKEDASERRMNLNIPASTPAGVYAVEIEAYSDDSSTKLSKKVAVVGASGNSLVVASATSRSTAIGEDAEYGLTLVNSGRNVRVYELVADTPTGITVEADEPFAAIPAGTSKAVKIRATATKAGTYPFTVSVYSEGNLVKKESFTLNVEGKSTGIVGTTGKATNTTVVLTVVLAIIFVVLLVVLIVLLTRKPQKSEELGESYY